MITIQGKGVYGAVAIGHISFFRRGEVRVRRERITDTQKEFDRFHKARTAAIAQLNALYEKALPEIGEPNAQIFDIHRMMLEDADFSDSVMNIIEKQHMNAEYAVAVTADNFALLFSSMEDSYMKERAADVKDVANRVLTCFSEDAQPAAATGDGLIICADDLAPSETVQLDKSRVLAFVTKSGSLNSHTAILARTMNIPAVIGAGDALTESLEGKPA
ncbi:MAG: phosphoenolpyruvate--protein phosphotransferase, partial [Clostridia bacterium]|nr:phosphoenolpyruvate--protein phosphotransferase [Clostridia bacterium]